MNKNILTFEEYKKEYQKSIKNPEKFWEEKANDFTWQKKWDTVLDWDFSKPEIKWFEGGKLNVSYNCLDRHVKAGFGDQIALIWEGNEPKEDKSYTY